jgi:hypothetical protein
MNAYVGPTWDSKGESEKTQEIGMRKLWSAVAVSALGVLTCAVCPTPAMAGNQSRAGINLGATSFFDGFGRPVEGFTYQAYLQYSRAREIMDANGDTTKAFVNPQLDTLVMLNQLSYYGPSTLFGDRVRPGINFILPLVGFMTSFDTPGPVLKDNGVGLGDLVMGPVFQFKPLMSDGRPVFSHRLELDLVVPTGKYDPDKNLNQGTNYVSFNPNWALTVLPAKGLEFTTRVNYIYHFTNERPTNPPRGVPMGTTVESARAGQAVWANFASSYEVFTGVHLGVNGYYLKQLTLDRFFLTDRTYFEGKKPAEGKQQVLGIGPGAFLEVTKKDKLFANYYYPLLVEARPKSQGLTVRWLHSF